MTTQFSIVRRLRGYSAHARFLAECQACESGDGTAAIVGWWRKPNGTMHPLHKWKLQFVAVVDDVGIRKNVLAIPLADVLTSPPCGCSACRQHFIDTGDIECLNGRSFA